MVYEAINGIERKAVHVAIVCLLYNVCDVACVFVFRCFRNDEAINDVFMISI